MVTALVTGANGFLGRRLAELLLARGANVRAMVRRGRAPAAFATLPIEMVEADLGDPASLAAAVDGAAVVYHCAALSSDWGRWRDFYAANVQGTQYLLAAAVGAGVEKFVHVSTTDVYGYPRVPCGEDHALRDVGLPYNRSKILAEQAVWECHRITNLPVAVVRPASIYGPRNNNLVVEAAHLIETGKMALLDGGRSGAGLIYVDDAAEAMIAAASAPDAAGRAYNLRHPDDMTWLAYFGALAETIGRPGNFLGIPRLAAWPAALVCEFAYSLLRRPERPILTRHAVNLLTRDQNFPIARSQRDLGFTPRFDLAAGMAGIRAWLDGDETLGG